MPVALKNIPRERKLKLSWNVPSAVLPWQSTTDQIFILNQNFRKFGCMPKMFTCFVDPEKAYDRDPYEKLWGVLREYAVDRHLC